MDIFANSDEIGEFDLHFILRHTFSDSRTLLCKCQTQFSKNKTKQNPLFLHKVYLQVVQDRPHMKHHYMRNGQSVLLSQLYPT